MKGAANGVNLAGSVVNFGANREELVNEFSEEAFIYLRSCGGLGVLYVRIPETGILMVDSVGNHLKHEVSNLFERKILWAFPSF